MDRLAILQGVYFLTSGIWPLLHLRSFEAITGPKTDGWLVKTVGVLVSVIGAVLIAAGLRRRVTPEIAILATGSGLGLAAIDVIHVANRRIRPIYLADAAVEVLLAILWARSR